MAVSRKPYIIIENYPAAKESDIPREALKKLNARLKRIKNAELDREIDFMKLMYISLSLSPLANAGAAVLSYYHAAARRPAAITRMKVQTS